MSFLVSELSDTFDVDDPWQTQSNMDRSLVVCPGEQVLCPRQGHFSWPDTEHGCSER